MKRARVIAEIGSFEQAARVEETVKTGYAEATQESIVNWMAVEEDLASSYAKLAERLSGSRRELAERLRLESAKNLETLAELLRGVESLDAQRTERIAAISKQAG